MYVFCKTIAKEFIHSCRDLFVSLKRFQLEFLQETLILLGNPQDLNIMQKIGSPFRRCRALEWAWGRMGWYPRTTHSMLSLGLLRPTPRDIKV